MKLAAMHNGLDDELRDRLLSRPEAVLEDAEVMAALIAANERATGGNVVDLRGIAMKRLEARLDRLEDIHRSVIAAAYENLAGTNLVHRAVLALVEPDRLDGFLDALAGPVAEVLRIASLRLVLETRDTAAATGLGALSAVIVAAGPGFVDRYAAVGRSAPARPVVLRQRVPEGPEVHGPMAPHIRSEALMRLDLGPGRLPGLLVFGAEDPHQFRPSQGTDLLAFLSGVVERSLRRFLG